MKPLLSASMGSTDEEIERNLEQLRFPLVASPKLDGIRVIIHPGLGPVTRNLKPIRNHFIRGKLEDMRILGLDGEIAVGEPTDPLLLTKTESAVMSFGGLPDFTFWVFDDLSAAKLPYLPVRYSRAEAAVERVNDAKYLRLLPYRSVHSIEELLKYEEELLAEGYEGVMLRCHDGVYKFGRSTFREHILIKLKRVHDDEATVVGYEQLYSNQNAPTKNELGYTKRTSHQENMVPLEMIGALICRSPRWAVEFRVGGGFDHAWRSEWWQKRDQLIGKTITYKYLPSGIKDRPRSSQFKAFREDIQ